NGQRDRTSVPGQALFLMNHPLMLSTAEQVAARAAQASTAAEQVERLFREILNRHPTAPEREQMVAFLQRERDRPTEIVLPPSYWSYGYGDVATDPDTVSQFAKLPFYTGTQFQGGAKLPDAKLGWVFLNAEGGHPGNDPKHAAVIRWTAPAAMTVSVNGTLRHDKEPGDGIRGQIFASGRRIAGPFILHQDSVATSIDSVTLAAGETLDFVVDIHGARGHDSFAWSPTIVELAAEPAATSGEPPTRRRWNYSEQFRPADPVRITPLASVAQVLLMSNEFHFVD
ncbi:MAG: DUF1553 domain-containing protein, partial [Novipirellula sp. JB048]